jgi:glycosyltransferase involved in cell wall biosynthesis
MRLLYLVHGFPPWERGGTEQHTAHLVHHLRGQGHEVHVVAATRAPGRPLYSTIETPGLTRIVNNIPARSLAQAEADPAINAAIQAVIDRFKPDLVHVQHLQFLSSSLRFSVPWVMTLHDQWMWCPSGGQGMRLPQGTACSGPTDADCANCHAAWRPVPSATARGLVATAGALAPWISPERLHRAWRRLPARLRTHIDRTHGLEEPPKAAQARREAMARLLATAGVRIAPSRDLARRAEEQGLGPIRVLDNAAPMQPGPREALPPDAPFLFLGAMAHHKGPDLVAAAWRQAFPTGDPPLHMHGPPGDVDPAHPVGPVLDRAGVRAALARSRALVLGSRWPENAPLVILEARAMGCPVIAPDIGGIPELVQEGVDGWLFTPNSVDDLAALLREARHHPGGTSRPPSTVSDQANALLATYQELLGAAACA